MLKIVDGIKTVIDKVLHLKGISSPAKGGMLESLNANTHHWRD